MKYILLTGGAGFIGSNFAPYFIENNPHYHIESNGSAIVIYRFDHNNAVDKVEQIISFGRELNRIIK